MFGFVNMECKKHIAINTILAKLKNNFIQIQRPEANGVHIMNQIKEIIKIEKTFMCERKFRNKWQLIESNIDNVNQIN